MNNTFEIKHLGELKNRPVVVEYKATDTIAIAESTQCDAQQIYLTAREENDLRRVLKQRKRDRGRKT